MIGTFRPAVGRSTFQTSRIADNYIEGTHMSAVPQSKNGIPVKSPDAFFIGGKWEKPAAKAKLDVISPVTEQVIMQFPEASPADVDRAVAAARQAFDSGPWPRMSAQERGAALL
jgi:hypothetical protein